MVRPDRKDLDPGIGAAKVKDHVRQIIVLAFGAFLGLTLVKFGNPVILDHLIQVPANGWELVFSTWPSRWVFNAFEPPWLLALLVIAPILATFSTRFPQTWRYLATNKPKLIIIGTLAGWYCWQWVAAADTISLPLTVPVLRQFTFCLFCFLFGLVCLNSVNRPILLWYGLLAGFAIVLWAGIDQRFGGLEATRRMIYEQGGLETYPEEFLQRISRGRIFATLFYPNALAGVILMLAPATIVFVYRITVHWGNVIWGLAVGLLAYLSAACLYWSGSKAGWLIAAAMLLVVVLRLPLPRLWKSLTVAAVLILALGAFGVRFATYFHQGATSVTARFDYWSAAVQVAVQNPATGSGPGTFQIPYAILKPANAEMARLVHNDYLQQASDSGIPGFLLYVGFVWGSLCVLYRKSRQEPQRFAIWLGLAAWGLHSFSEFGLYIPAIAWPAFTLMGWLLGNRIDTAE